MHGYYLFTILILVTTFLSFVNYKFVKLPPTISVTLLSLFISVAMIILRHKIPELNDRIRANLDDIEFDEIVMNVLLGFLLFAAAFKMDAPGFKKHLPVVLAMAFLSTLVSTFIVGTLVYYSFMLLHQEIPFLHCLLFGALISPTDPIAALAVLGRVGIPRKMEMQMTGESLFNDGVAIVIFTTILNLGSYAGDEVTATDTLLLFLRQAGGALLFGGALGALAFYLLKQVNNYKLEILLTISVVTGGYTLARMIDVSPPIFMVVTGLICSVGGERNRGLISHEFVQTFWELIEDFINVVLFLLIGIGVFVIPLNAQVIQVAFITIVLVLIARYMSLLPVYALLRRRFEKRSLPLYTWAALRGAVSIALALSVPYSMHRSEFLALTYVIAVFSIIVQGLTIGPLASRLGLRSK